jgi:DNA-binding MarR family transcriptional regulator
MREGRGAAKVVGALLFDLLMTERKRFMAIAAEEGLPLMQAATLWRLGSEKAGLPMRSLAEHCGCDPSNVTGIVDKLELRGLIRREAAPGDRRVKRIVLTTQGERVQARITERLHEPPAWVLDLSLEDQRRLRDLLERGLRSQRTVG